MTKNKRERQSTTEPTKTETQKLYYVGQHAYSVLSRTREKLDALRSNIDALISVAASIDAVESHRFALVLQDLGSSAHRQLQISENVIPRHVLLQAIQTAFLAQAKAFNAELFGVEQQFRAIFDPSKATPAEASASNKTD